MQNLTAHLKELEAEQQRHPKPSRRREIIKTRAEINHTESKKTGADQWNQELFFWKNKQNWLTSSRASQKEKGDDPNR